MAIKTVQTWISVNEMIKMLSGGCAGRDTKHEDAVSVERVMHGQVCDDEETGLVPNIEHQFTWPVHDWLMKHAWNDYETGRIL